MKNVVLFLVLLATSFLSMLGSSHAQSDTDELKLIYAKGDVAACDSVDPTGCVAIRLTPDSEWELHFEGIHNFQYSLGFEYVLLVREVGTLEGDAELPDTSSTRYQLVRIVESTPVDEVALENLPYEDTNEFFIMTVASETAECVGLGPQTCLQIRFNVDDEWQFHYDQIAGFAHEVGYEYQLLVRKAELQGELLADASSFIYKLDQILSKTPIE